MEKYKRNLRIDHTYSAIKVYSYGTHVATLRGNVMTQHGYWSMTTQKHINYVAKEFGVSSILKPTD